MRAIDRKNLRPSGYSINVRARTQTDGSIVYFCDVRARLARRRYETVAHFESRVCEHAVEMASSIVTGRLIDEDHQDV